MTFMLNGVDFSRYLYRYGMTVQYEKIYGKAGGQTLDGRELVDLIRVRPILVCACNPMTSDEFSRLATVCAEDYIFVSYTDPKTGGDVRMEAVPILSAAKKTLVINGVTYWEGAVITLKER